MYWVDELIQTYCHNKGIRATPERIDKLLEYYTDQGYICSLGLTCSALNYDSKTVEILRGGVDCIPGKGVKYYIYICAITADFMRYHCARLGCCG